MEYSEGSYGINKIGEFKNRKVEQAYMGTQKKSILKQTRVILLLVGIFFFGLLIYDYGYMANEVDFLYSLVARLCVLFTTVIFFFAADKFKNYKNALLMVSATELILFFAYIFLLRQQGAQGFMEQAMAVMLIVLVVFLLPNRWMNDVITAFAIVVSFILLSGTYIVDRVPSQVTEVTIYLCASVFLAALISYGWNRSRRRQYANEKKLEYISSTDNLTGIYNRLHFESELNRQIAVAEEYGGAFSVILFDLDDFKKVNDRYGHATGDAVLVGMAEVITQNIREGDVFARWGGEEFVVLFPGADRERASELAERLRRAVEESRLADTGRVTISVGVAEYQPDDTESSIIGRADDRMYQAKQAGKNRVVYRQSTAGGGAGGNLYCVTSPRERHA